MAFSTTPTEGADRLFATADNETINGLGGNDRIRSGFNGSTLNGGNGHDRISVALELQEPTAGADNDRSATLSGGDGDDWLVSDFSVNSTDQLPEFSFNFVSRQAGGNGNDNIFISALGAGDYYPIGIFDFDVFGGDGADDIWIEVTGTGVSNSNFVDAGTGADIVYITYDASGDFGGATNEVYAGEGDDDVLVSGDAGWMDASNNNTVWGEDGNDRLEAMTSASSGFNRLFGGEGDDTLIATGEVWGDPSTNLRNSAWGGDGNDTIEMSGISWALFSGITHTAYGDGGNDTITSVTEGSSSGEGGTSDADTMLDGGAGNDVLTATTIFGAEDDASGGARLYGRTGDDVLRVYGGVRNTLDGGAGDDTITGGTGADRIIGGPGADTLRGGGGNDAFIFLFADGVAPSPRDTILDFGTGSAARGDDIIDLSRVDANVDIAGNQAFVFGGTGVGQVWVEENPDTAGSLVMANTGGAELLMIAVEDWASRDASDWVRGDFVL